MPTSAGSTLHPADVAVKLLTRSPLVGGGAPSASQKVAVNLDICRTSAGHLSTVSCLAMGQNPALFTIKQLGFVDVRPKGFSPFPCESLA